MKGRWEDEGEGGKERGKESGEEGGKEGSPSYLACSGSARRRKSESRRLRILIQRQPMR